MRALGRLILCGVFFGVVAGPRTGHAGRDRARQAVRALLTTRGSILSATYAKAKKQTEALSTTIVTHVGTTGFAASWGVLMTDKPEVRTATALATVVLAGAAWKTVRAFLREPGRRRDAARGAVLAEALRDPALRRQLGPISFQDRATLLGPVREQVERVTQDVGAYSNALAAKRKVLAELTLTLASTSDSAQEMRVRGRIDRVTARIGVLARGLEDRERQLQSWRGVAETLAHDPATPVE